MEERLISLTDHFVKGGRKTVQTWDQANKHSSILTEGWAHLFYVENQQLMSTFHDE